MTLLVAYLVCYRSQFCTYYRWLLPALVMVRTMLVSFEEPVICTSKPILLNLPVTNNVKNSPRRNISNCWLEYSVQNLRACSQSTHTKFHTYFYKKISKYYVMTSRFYEARSQIWGTWPLASSCPSLRMYRDLSHRTVLMTIRIGGGALTLWRRNFLLNFSTSCI
jgi:hypothetical protein